MDFWHCRGRYGLCAICVGCGRRHIIFNTWRVRIRRYSNIRRVRISRMLLTLATFSVIFEATISFTLPRNQISNWNAKERRMGRLKLYLSTHRRRCRNNRISDNGLVRFRVNCSATPSAGRIWMDVHEKYILSSAIAINKGRCADLLRKYGQVGHATPENMDRDYPGWDKC